MSKRVLRIWDIPRESRDSEKKSLLPVSPATIWRWTKEGKFPKPFKLSPAVTVWDADEVEAFIKQRTQEAG